MNNDAVITIMHYYKPSWRMTPEMKFMCSQRAKSEIQYWLEPYEMYENSVYFPFKYQNIQHFIMIEKVWHQMPYGWRVIIITLYLIYHKAIWCLIIPILFTWNVITHSYSGYTNTFWLATSVWVSRVGVFVQTKHFMKMNEFYCWLFHLRRSQHKFLLLLLFLLFW